MPLRPVRLQSGARFSPLASFLNLFPTLFRVPSFWLHSCGRSEGSCVSHDGKPDRKGGSFRFRIVIAKNFSAMFADDTVADAQAQARTFANVFRGEKRIKDDRGVGNARAIIAERYFHE